MKQIIVNIPEFGKAVGTTAWVAEKLELINKSLKQGTHKKTGLPALIYTCPISDTKRILCLPYCGKSDEFTENIIMQKLNDTYCLFPISSEYNWGLFDFLTPKADEYVVEYLDKITQEWSNKLNEL